MDGASHRGEGKNAFVSNPKLKDSCGVPTGPRHNVSNLGVYGWNDRILSLKVGMEPQHPRVWVQPRINAGGGGQPLEPGKYDRKDLGVGSIRALYIPAGLTVTVYDR